MTGILCQYLDIIYLSYLEAQLDQTAIYHVSPADHVDLQLTSHVSDLQSAVLGFRIRSQLANCHQKTRVTDPSPGTNFKAMREMSLD